MKYQVIYTEKINDALHNFCATFDYEEKAWNFYLQGVYNGRLTNCIQAIDENGNVCETLLKRIS